MPPYNDEKVPWDFGSIPQPGRPSLTGIYFYPFAPYNVPMATTLLVIIYLIFISLGLPDSLLGSAWPVAHVALGAQVSAAGLTSVFITAGTVVSSLVAVTAIRKMGAGLVTAISVAMTALALLGISWTDRFATLCLLSLPLGLGAGSIDAVLNQYVATHYNALQMNLLHAFWGVGATCGPLIMAAFLAKGGNWHGGYRTVGLIQLSIAAMAFLALPLWRRLGRAEAEAGGGKAEIAGNREAFFAPGVKLGMLSFFFYCAAEMSAGLWAATYYVEARGVAPDKAASYGSLFFFGIMAGRVLAGLVSRFLGERRLIRYGLALAAAGILWMLLAPVPYTVGGLLLMGLGCGPVFPNLLQLTPERFGLRVSQAAMGLQMAAAYLGSTLMPPLFGLACQRVGFGLLPYFILACVGGLLLLTQRLNRYGGGTVPKS